MPKLKAWYKWFSGLSVTSKITLFLLFILAILYFISVSKKGGDFASYLEASQKMLMGANIYDPPYIHLRYSYSPFWAMALIPIAMLPLSAGVFIWLAINVFLLWRTVILLRDYFDIKNNNLVMDRILWFIIILFMSRFIELNFHHAQMTIFLLWSILESIRLANKEHEIGAGILIGVAIIIKIMPIVIIPYWLYRRKIKASLMSIATVFITFFLPIIFIGQAKFIELNKTWFQILRPDNSDFQLDNTGYFPHNLSALLYRLLTKTDAPYVKNILSLKYDTATICVWFIIALLILFTLFFLSTLPFKKIASKNHILYEISYITLVMPLIFPHQMKYAFYFLLPAICCLVKTIADKYSDNKKDWKYHVTISLVIISFILCTMTTDLIIGMPYSIITQYLKTITIGTLLLIPALAINKKHFT
jgi:hypothetical protein